MTNLFAESCYPADIQAAVNAVYASGGGIVFLPSETGEWYSETVTVLGGVDVIAQNPLLSILHQNTPYPFNLMFKVDGRNGRNVRVSGIEFQGKVTSNDDNANLYYSHAIQMYEVPEFRVDHCKFTDFPCTAISVTNSHTGTTTGVIDHNILDNPYKDIYGGIWGYGVSISGKTLWSDYDITHFLGKYDDAPIGHPIVYLEDNVFSRCRHAIACNQGAWYVARYNTISEERIKSYPSMDVHGTAGAGYPGGRGLEAYHNLIIGSVGYTAAIAFGIRGGGGVIFNNEMQNIGKGILLENESAYGSPDYAQVHELYIWNNTMDRGTPLDPKGYIENIDYFLYERGGYIPYPYPHPLTLEAPPPKHRLTVNTSPLSGIPFKIRRVG